MANDTRQERLLMRQRGAGSRQINNIDFGFAFTTPNQLRRSRTRSQTPQTVTRGVRQSTRTPKDSGRSVLEDVRSTIRSNKSTHSANTKTNHEDIVNSGQRPSKRRRLSEISNLTSVTNATVTEQSLHNDAIATLSQFEKVPSEASLPYSYGNDAHIETFPKTIYRPSDDDKENDTSHLSGGSVPQKRRKRKSIGQQKPKKKRESLKSKVQVSPSLEVSPHISGIEVHIGDSLGVASHSEAPMPSLDEHESGLVDVTLNQPTQEPENELRELPVNAAAKSVLKRQRKRKSIVLTKRKRRPTEKNSQSITNEPDDAARQYVDDRSFSKQQRRETRSDSGFDDGQEQSEQEINDMSRTVNFTHKERPLREPIEVQSDDSEDSDQDYHPDEASPNPTPAPNRKAKPKEPKLKKAATNKTSREAIESSNRGKSTFPVLIHRLTNPYYLPTIEEVSEGEQAAQGESVPTQPHFTMSNNPNAIDVFAQICRETVESAIGTVQKQSQAGRQSKSQVKQSITALENFRSQLETRLFDVSQSLDQRFELESRLRKSRREKALVQSQWLDLRKRRDKIALQIDAVRRQHWENEVIGKRAWEASEAARRLEVEVHRDADVGGNGKIDEGQRLEVMLRNLVEDVSSADGRGVLQKLKSFNAQLERFTSSCEVP